MKLRIDGSKSYAFVVLRDSEVTFLGQVKDIAFCFSIIFNLYDFDYATQSNFVLFHTSGGISSWHATFLFLIFFSVTLSSSSLKCLSLITSWQMITFLIGFL